MKSEHINGMDTPDDSSVTKQTFNLCIYHYVYAVILDLNIKNFIKYYFNHCLAYSY